MPEVQGSDDAHAACGVVMNKDRRIRRVTKGLYRGETRSQATGKWEGCGVLISYFPFGAQKALPWNARWKDWMSTDRVKHFRTYKEAHDWFLEIKEKVS